MAYESNESGRYEVYVRPAGGSGGRWQISANGGASPAGAGTDGRSSTKGASLMAAPVSTAGGTVRPGVPVELFRSRAFAAARSWDVHPDGKRFLIAEPEETEEKPPSIHVIQNWPALLREKSPQ